MSEDRDVLDDAPEADLVEDQDLDTLEPEDDLEDDPPEDLDEGDEPLEAQPAPQARKGASETIRELRARAQEAERRAAENERRAEEALRARNQEDFQRQERERLEMMSPEERVEYRVNQRLNQIQFSTWDTNDRVMFEGLVSSNPAVAALKSEVEQVFQDRIRQGAPVDRQTIATFLIGQKALAKAPRAKAAGARAAAAGKERNQVRASSGRGDAAPAGRTRMTEQEARAKRLQDVTF